jgi:YopX protein
MIKFKVWNGEKYLGTFTPHDLLSGFPAPHEYQFVEDLIFKRFTGLTDVNGKEVYEGDNVVVYPSNYVTTHIEGNVYEADITKPLPLQDVVLFIGTIRYNAPEFEVEVKENDRGVAAVNPKNYWLEII